MPTPTEVFNHTEEWCTIVLEILKEQVLFIANGSVHAAHFAICILDFLTSMEEMLCKSHEFADGRPGPWFLLYVLVGILEKCKLLKETVVQCSCTVEGFVRWVKCKCSLIVYLDSIPDRCAPALEVLCNVCPGLVTCKSTISACVNLGGHTYQSVRCSSHIIKRGIE